MRILELCGSERDSSSQLTGKSTVILLPVLLQDVLQEVLVVVLPLPDLLHVDHPPGYMEDPVPRNVLEYSSSSSRLTCISSPSGCHRRAFCRPQ